MGRYLKTTQPIPVAYLKAGKDNGSYDLEKLLWLPGRTTAVRRPDYKAAGLQKKGQDVRLGVGAPAPKPQAKAPSRPVSEGTAPKVREGTGLLIPKRQPHIPPKLVLPNGR